MMCRMNKHRNLGLLRLRKELFANLRPAIVYPALAQSSHSSRKSLKVLIF